MTRLVWQLVGTLLLVGFMLKYWWLIVLVAAAVILYRRGPGWWAAHQASVAAEKRRLAAIAARADQQHAWVLAGDPRGTYGAEITVAAEGEPDRRRGASDLLLPSARQLNSHGGGPRRVGRFF
jgi:endonuclease/exonuclease/phosphatase (EEP) superfamily protein YafD